MRNFNKIRKMSGGGNNPSPYGYGLFSWSDQTPSQFFGLQGNINMQGTDAAIPNENEPISIAGITSPVVFNPDELKKQELKFKRLRFLEKSGLNKIGNSIASGGVAYDILLNGMTAVNAYVNKDLVNGNGFNTMNGVFDMASNYVGKVNPMVGLAIKATQTGINLINKGTSKETDSYSIDEQTQNAMGGSYSGSYRDMVNAESKAGLEYGGFNRKTYKEALNLIALAKQMDQTIQSINEDNLTRLAMAANMQANNMNYANKLNGGIDARYLRAAKLGIKLININRLKSFKTPQIVNINTKQVEEFKQEGTITEPIDKFKEGGIIDFNPVIYSYTDPIETDVDFVPIISEEIIIFKDGGKSDKKPKNRTIEELIEYAKTQNPRFILRMSEPVRDLDLGNGQRGTHLMSWGTDDNGNAIVYSEIQENNNGDLFNYGDAAIERALKNKNYLIMTPEEAKLFTESGIDENGNLFGYKKGWPEFFNPSKQFPQEYIDFKNSLPDNLKNTPENEYDTYLGWKLYGKPKDFELAKKLGMYTWDNSDNSWHGNTIAWDETTGIGHFLKPKHHSTIGYELDWFDKGIITEEGGKQREMTPEERKDWEEFKVNYNLIDDGNFYKYVPKNKQGGQIKESEELVKLEETNLKNIIPEGALHKNKHHIENTKGLTLKGIPVIDNDGEQQAEIELDEIIFTLEVTKKLEELHKIYKEGSNKERDEAAIEAGKLLVQEILYNTDDRTGLISKCKEGGKING